MLTKHHQTAHSPDAGKPRPPEGSNECQYPCNFEGCLHSFNMKGMLTQHSRLQHQSCPVPVTTPSSLLPSEHQTPRAPPIGSHSLPMTPYLFPEPSNEMDIDQLHVNSPHYNNDDFMSAGGGSDYFIPQGSDDFISPRSDNSHHSGTHWHSSSPCFVHGNSTHPSATGGNASDHVKRSYHLKINGKFI